MAQSPQAKGLEPPRPIARILLVDDNPENLAILRAMLEPLEQVLVEASSGEEALLAVAKYDFAVVLLDVFLPGMSGYETAKHIRQIARARHTPIIFQTAQDVTDKDLDAAYSLGAVDVLIKPVLPVVVQGKVRVFVEIFNVKQEAKRQADQLKLLVHGTTDYAIFMLDPKGHVMTWNLGAERLKGYSASEIIGEHFSRFYPEEALARNWPGHELLVAGQEGRFEDEGWRIRKDGTRFWANVVITALRNEDGELRGFSKVTRDLTERRRAEEAARRLIEETTARRVAEENARQIQEQRERLRVTLASIGDGVITTDGQGRVEFLNGVAEELVGWKSHEVAQRSLTEVFHIVNEETRKPVDNPALRALRDGRIVGLANHTILISRQGIERPIDDSAAPIRDADGVVIGSVLVFRDISDKKQYQAALRESESRFRGLMEQAPFSIQVFSPDGHTVRVNRAWEELWGINLDQVSDYNILQDPQLEAKGIAPYIRRAFAGEAVIIPAIEYDPDETLPDRSHHENPKRWVSAVAYPLKDQYGLVREVILVHEDVTVRRKTDEALRTSEERLRLALEAGRMGVWDWNLRTNKVDWSDSMELIHGLAPGTFDGTFEAFQRLIHPHDRDNVYQTIQNSIELGRSGDFEFRTVWPDGSLHWIAGKGMTIPGPDGRPERMIGIGLDVTQRRRAERSAQFLAEASASLSVLVDFDETLQKVASLAVPHFADWVTVDLLEDNGTLRRVAASHPDPSKVALANELHSRFPPDKTSSHGTWHIIKTGMPEMVSTVDDDLLARSISDPELLQIVQKLGLKSYIGVPLKIRDKVLGVITFISAESSHHYDAADLAVAQDLADRGAIAIENTRLYGELRTADRRKDEFLATLAHELRNPLAPIRNSLQILKMVRVDAEILQQTREMMERQVHHLVRLVDDLLDVSRVMRGKIELRKEQVELATIVARAVETAMPLIEAQGHQLELSMPSDSLLVDADPVRLSQVVGNLLTNSAKYSEPHGQIQLSAERDSGYVVLTITDRGIGIAPEMLPEIFELFVQADQTSTKSQGGLGIGLTLVKNLVEMHGGTVEAQSEGIGHGSTFTVRLPLASPTGISADANQDAQHQQPKLATGHRLMVVDDNHDAGASLATLLRLQGHDVQLTHDGLSALRIAADFKPEMIFLDLGMPGMDGYQVAQQIRTNPALKDTVLTALTGWGQQEDRRRTAEAGFDHHLVKPPEPEVVEKLVASLGRPG